MAKSRKVAKVNVAAKVDKRAITILRKEARRDKLTISAAVNRWLCLMAGVDQ